MSKNFILIIILGLLLVNASQSFASEREIIERLARLEEGQKEG